MDQTKELVKTIVEGLQEKRGKNIVTVDLSQTSGAICQYMVICEGNTPTQVSALSDSVWDFARKNANEKPLSIDGTRALNGSAWIMARFLYIYSCRNNVHFITWRTFGQTRRLYKYLTLIKPV